MERYGLPPEALRRAGRHTEMRAVAAWLAKRHREATLRELAGPLGLGRPQRVGNLTRRMDLALRTSPKLRRTIAATEAKIIDRRSARLRGRAIQRKHTFDANGSKKSSVTLWTIGVVRELQY